MVADAPFLHLTLEDEEATQRLAGDLAPILRAGDCLLLSGDLGMGKTTLARALIRAFLSDEEAIVPSPTFTIVNPFEEGRCPLHHFDLYRIEHPDDLEEIGFKEAMDAGIGLVEWPECAASEMPQIALTIRFESAGDGRTVCFSGSSSWQRRIERTFYIRTFLDQTVGQGAKRHFLQGDASTRSYEKIKTIGGPRAVLMDAPATKDGAIVKDGKRYSELAHLAEDVRPFVAIGETLRAKGLSAPALYGHDLDAGLLLVEDFGVETVLVDGKPAFERYGRAVDVLAHMHGEEWPLQVSLPDDSVYDIPRLDWTVFEIEISLLPDWYAPHVLDKTFSQSALEAYFEIWRTLFDVVSTGEKSWMLRDYHSPNLMWRSDEAGLDQIGLIDYQDALMGPAAYDMASLCQDARQTISPDMEADLVTRYVDARLAQGKSFDEVSFRRDYAIIAAERNTRLLGLWPRLKHRDGKPHYMQHMPRTRDYLKRTLSHPILFDLKCWYDKNLPL